MKLNEETESEFVEKLLSITCGITLENFQAANGWEKIDEVDGRQRITLSLESLATGDEISFSVKISYWYIFTQIWIYPYSVSLIVGESEQEGRKAKEQLEEEAETKIISASSGKGGCQITTLQH